MVMRHWCFAQIALQLLMHVLVDELKGYYDFYDIRQQMEYRT